VFDALTLGRYTVEDLDLMRRVRPDLVLGDFRLSLAVSAPTAGIPYAALTNAHWSPHASHRRWPVPEHASTHLLGTQIAQAGFNLGRPFIFAAHCRPLNCVRRQYGLVSLSSLQDVYTHGDHTLYLDTPTFAPTRELPDSHEYIGPVLWSPDLSLPDWWKSVDWSRPTVYATLGSSGQLSILPVVLQGLSEAGANILLASAGRRLPGTLPSRCYVTDYLPGLEAARAAGAVLCNGGSATVYQALSVGRPVLGIPSNLDQHLTMQLTCSHGAGLMLRPERLRPGQLVATLQRLLDQPGYGRTAAGIAEDFACHDCRVLFPAWLRKTLDSCSRASQDH
jgi:UDP:flavonoid glycosyltransferase YjiC (YdhE family)